MIKKDIKTGLALAACTALTVVGVGLAPGTSGPQTAEAAESHTICLRSGSPVGIRLKTYAGTERTLLPGKCTTTGSNRFRSVFVASGSKAAFLNDRATTIQVATPGWTTLTSTIQQRYSTDAYTWLT